MSEQIQRVERAVEGWRQRAQWPHAVLMLNGLHTSDNPPDIASNTTLLHIPPRPFYITLFRALFQTLFATLVAP